MTKIYFKYLKIIFEIIFENFFKYFIPYILCNCNFSKLKLGVSLNLRYVFALCVKEKLSASFSPSFLTANTEAESTRKG